jgi:hypothetical protein
LKDTLWEKNQQTDLKFVKKTSEFFNRCIKYQFSKTFLENLAREHKFVQRKSTLAAHQFVDMLMFSSKPSDQLSLEDLANDFCEQYGISITKQALQERFNDFAVAFMSDLLKKQLAQQLPPVAQTKAYRHFNRIRVKDSTRYSVPKEYVSNYKGQGGIGTAAQISIQYEYDLLTGIPIALELTSACRNDQQDSKETLDNIEKGDLLIRDLGYTSQGYIQHIVKTKAYYLNRFNPKWKIYDKDGVLINFSKIRKRLNKHSISLMEFDAFISIGKEQLPTRLVISKVDDRTYSKRLAKAQIAAASKGYQLSDSFKTCAALNLFITNIPRQWLKSQEIRATYSLRWQIELIFKVWKSQGNINKVKAMKIQRFQCQLLAKFLWILLHWKMLRVIQEHLRNQSKNKYYKCSIWKFYKIAFRLSNLLRRVLLKHAKPSGWINALAQKGERKYFTETKTGKLCDQKVLFNLLA